MSVDLIRYDLLVQDALRSVVRRVLTDVARDGLPGDHHLYLSFDTRAAGVRISPRLKERYPEEMTIVLQHQFWDLQLTDQFFEVGLSFNGIPERLHIPYAALKGFFDPSVKFGLQFEPVAEEDEVESEETHAEPASPAPVTSIGEARPTSVPSTRASTRGSEAEPGEKSATTRAPGRSESAKPAAVKPAASPRAEPKPASAKAGGASTAKPEAKAESKPELVRKEAAGDDEPKDGGSGGAQVVRLDAFRKK